MRASCVGRRPSQSRPCGSGKQPDGAPCSRGPGEASVAGHKFASEDLCEGDVRGVVGRDVVAKLVGASHESKGGVPIDGHGFEIVNRQREASSRDRLRQPSLSQDGNGLDVDQIRCGDLASRSKFGACPSSVGAIVSDDVRKHRCIENDQRRSRCSATSAAAWRKPTEPPRRRSIRSRTSSRVGLSASRFSSPARYCCSDCPRCSARLWSAAWTSSGRSRTRTLGMLT